MTIDTIIKIPENIKIYSDLNSKLNEHNYIIEGPLGWSSLNLSRLDKTGSSSISILTSTECKSGHQLDDKNKTIVIRGLNPETNILYKKIIENKFKGVSRGFCVTLEIVGVGYRAMILGDNDNKRLCLKVGTSHDIHYKIPKGVGIFLQNPTTVCIFGVDLNQVTQCAHSIRSTRVPSRYKAKGIRLSTEKIVTKAGKR